MSAIATPGLSRTPTTSRCPAGTRALVREQSVVAAGQLAAGAGNLLFALLAARVLGTGAFAELAVFLALFLVVHVPLSALSAGSAVTSTFATTHRTRVIGIGLVTGLALAALALPLGRVLDVPATLLLVLAAGVPSAGWLALERGRLIGEGHHGRAVSSLVAEPLLRLGLGLPLAAATGAVGGAVGVVAGGWLALLATRPGLPRRDQASGASRSRPDATTGTAGVATLAFLLLAIVQNADVVLANALLADGAAGRFAVLSTIGGIAAFATTTIPLVLLPRVRESPGALPAALATAALLGAGAVAVVSLAPAAWVGAAFGSEYEEVTPLIAPYVGGMALLGIGRVVVAERVAAGRGRPLVIGLGVLAVLHSATVLLVARTPQTVAAVTIATMALLVALGGVSLLVGARPVTERRRRRPERQDVLLEDAPVAAAEDDAAPVGERVPWKALAALTLLALLVRCAITRGIWLDEAISVTQAQMPWQAMLDALRANDVHPPLHHAVLWLLAHAFGTDEWVMRAPSLLAGALLVPAIYALGHVLWDRRAGLLAAALVSVAPFLVWYSQEARMYAFFMLFAVLALLGQAWALRGGGLRAWALYAVATALLLWTQYFSIAFVGVQQLAFLATAVRRVRVDRHAGLRFTAAWLAATLVVVAALVPLAPLAIDQFQANESSGRGFDQGPSQAGDVANEEPRPGIYVVLTNLAWAVLGYHSNETLSRLTALWPLAMLGALLILGRRPTWRAHLVIACAIAPAALLFVLAMAKPFLFEIRYFIASAPLLLLMLARGITAWNRDARVLAPISVVLVAALGVATADELANGANPRRYDFRGALEQVEDRMRPGDVLVYEPAYLRNVITYYQPRLRAAPLSEGLPERRWARRVFLLTSFLDRPLHRTATTRALKQLRGERRQVERFSRPQVQVTVFR